MPVKAFELAKTRLRPALTADQCSALAQNMAADVIDALHESRRLQGISLLGDESGVAEFARKLNCEFLAEDPNADLSANLDAAAAKLQSDGVANLLVVPGDLPMLRGQHVDGLLACHTDGLSICEAGRDGGTNALVISPPTAIDFRFGRNSARRHMEAAGAAGLRCHESTEHAFDRDIDTPEDLLWFCRKASPGRTTDYLTRSGICEILLGAGAAAIA